MADGTPATVTKGEFAKLRGVTPGRVSQWIKEGKIGPDALDGIGRSARIRVSVACEQLRGSLDLSQRMGLNGLGTNLDAGATAAEEGAAAVPPKDPTVEDRIKAETLANKQLQNRRLLAEERERAGLYMRTADAQQQMARIAGQMMKIFEGGLTDMANDLAGKFGLAQRDIQHALRTNFRDVRTAATKAARKSLAGMADHIEDDDGNGDGNPSGEPGEGGDAGPD